MSAMSAAITASTAASYSAEERRVARRRWRTDMESQGNAAGRKHRASEMYECASAT
jgi:hypothetical protein